jgi:hypothetical protein
MKHTPIRKVCDTKTLCKLNAHAVERGFNRTLPQTLLEQLAPDGWHLVRYVMRHINFEGLVSERVRLLVTVRGSVEPEEYFVDVEVGDFLALPAADSL